MMTVCFVWTYSITTEVFKSNFIIDFYHFILFQSGNITGFEYTEKVLLTKHDPFQYFFGYLKF